MRKTFTITFLAFLCFGFLKAQITYRGCEGFALGAQDYILHQTGTTSDAGTIRNTFESTPSDFTQSCPAGVCELRIIWSIANSRWELQLDNDGPLGTPDYTTAVLFFNTTASAPNPPSLSLGTWVDNNGGSCGGDGSFTTFTGDVQSSLPVELVSFVAYVNHDNEVSLSWSTASETNNDFFTVLRSRDSELWEEVGTLEGAGNSTDVNTYVFTDHVPYAGNSRYRLKQTDFDGKTSLSQVLSVDNSNYQSLTVYPNPSNGIVTVRGERSELETIRFINSIGQDVTSLVNTVSQKEMEVAVDVSHLVRGLYFIQTEKGAQKLYVE